jgi:glucosamine-6-phosphate deaminase
MTVDRALLLEWCRVPWDQLERHPDRRIPLRVVPDSAELGRAMAAELFDLIVARSKEGLRTRAIVPCGPMSWYRPFSDLVNGARQSLAGLTVFHMDECLDWQGRPLAAGHPYNFRSVMEHEFYDPIDASLRVPRAERHWLLPDTMRVVAEAVAKEPVDLALGGWGQDGHVAYNQARRDPYHRIGVPELARSTVRIQENNLDTVIALAQRTFGGGYQFVPPMSVTLGMVEVLGAKRVRLFSDTGSWKQTALRIALFSEPDPEYPITLLQTHSDAMLTATIETVDHPISHHPEWDLG